MPSESGDMKLLGNFRQLIDQVSADTSYNPANVVLAKTALETQHGAARAAVEAVLNMLAPMSFDNRLGNLSAYIAILNKVAAYDPNEADLKVTALKTMAADLQAKNDAVSSTFVPLSQARGIRDDLLYTGPNCVVNVALLVQAYVNAALGSSSQPIRWKRVAIAKVNISIFSNGV